MEGRDDSQLRQLMYSFDIHQIGMNLASHRGEQEEQQKDHQTFSRFPQGAASSYWFQLLHFEKNFFDDQVRYSRRSI